MKKSFAALALLFAAAFASAQTQFPPTSGSVGGGSSGGGGGGTVTSVSGGTTGITVAQPTTTPTLGGILNKANGGTGTATPALVAGTNITITGSWPNNTINASAPTPGGSANQVQYNNGTTFAGDPNFNLFASSAVYTGALGLNVTYGIQSGTATITGLVTAGSFSGNGASITALNASSLASGTAAVTVGGTGTTTTFTLGSVVFAGASGVYTQDNAAFFWDDVHTRLGIGTATPVTNIDIESSGQAAITINSLAGSANYIEYKSNGRPTWDVGRELLAGDVGMEWNNTATNVDQMKLSSTGDLTVYQGVFASSGTFTGTMVVGGNSALGTTLGTGTQVYRCSGGTDAGWVLYGNSGAAQTLCTGGGGSLVATGVFLP